MLTTYFLHATFSFCIIFSRASAELTRFARAGSAVFFSNADALCSALGKPHRQSPKFSAATFTRYCLHGYLARSATAAASPFAPRARACTLTAAAACAFSSRSSSAFCFASCPADGAFTGFLAGGAAPPSSVTADGSATSSAFLEPPQPIFFFGETRL